MAAQTINSQNSGPVWFTFLDFKNAFVQLQLSDLVIWSAVFAILLSYVENLRAHTLLQQDLMALLTCQRNL